MNDNFSILAIIFVITHTIRTIYELLKHNKKLKASKLSFMIIFINMALLWASWFGLCSLDPQKADMPGFIQYSGLILVILGGAAFLSGLATIKSLETYDGNLITHGIYSKIRHPMYLGFILWLIGMPLYSEGLISVILSIVACLNVLFWRNLEEKELDNRFPGYKEYKAKTIF